VRDQDIHKKLLRFSDLQILEP